MASIPGEGTTFTLSLPLADGEGPPAAEPVPATAVIGARILLVEDEPLLLPMVQLMLTELGHQVLAAASPDEALQLAEEHRGAIDLLVTDLVLPKMDGRELADTLQVANPGLRVLFISGHALPAVDPKTDAKQGAGFLQKPFRMHDLGRKVQEVLRQPAPGGRP